MIEQLVVNGCSYMAYYAQGNGQVDLARRLQIPHAYSIAQQGSANSRIIRTTLKHSYQTTVPTLYILGITFLSRWEISVSATPDEFEGRWINVTKQDFQPQIHWSKADTELFTKLNFKGAVYGISDMLEDLMFRLLSLISDLHSRGHRVLIYNQIDSIIHEFLDQDQFKLFNQPTFVDGLKWCAIPWQRVQGVPPLENDPSPEEVKHLVPGRHGPLNKFLVNYINEHSILK